MCKFLKFCLGLFILLFIYFIEYFVEKIDIVYIKYKINIFILFK